LTAEHTPQEKAVPTIWRVPDGLWDKVEPILNEHDPPKGTDRSRIDQRAALDAIIFRLRTGCQWNHLPREEFPDDSEGQKLLPANEEEVVNIQGADVALWPCTMEELQRRIRAALLDQD